MRLTLPGLSLSARFEDKDGLEFKDLMVYLRRPFELCCGIGVQGTVSFTKEQGFFYVPKSARIVWPEGDIKMEPFGSPGPHLTWVTGAALDAGETLTVTFKARVTSAAILDKVVKNLMTASAVDDYFQPIPADASEFAPADTDPDDASVLHLIVRPEVEDGGS